MTREIFSALVGAALLAAGSGIASANGVRAVPDLAEQGRMLVEANCARCHAIGKDDESGMEEAPPLREFAAQWPLDALEEALAEGIVTGHPDMPEFQFTSDEIVALIAYLETLGE